MDEGLRGRLLGLIRAAPAPDPPVAPGPLPRPFAQREFPAAGPLAGIRAVLWDVYGTLFASAAGDVGTAAEGPNADLDVLAREIATGLGGEDLRRFFRAAVLEEHRRLAARTSHPEVRVEEIWARLPGLRSGTDAEEVALRYELAVNPVVPMESLSACLESLREAGLPLGIVSNAQFFTPLLFEGLLGVPPEGLGFDRDLLQYSFAGREGKPAPSMFRSARAVLQARGIRAEEALFVGNDMRNDVCAAQDAGFRAALFAGDARSLRLRTEEAGCAGRLPDAVLRRLSDAPALVGIAPTGRHAPPRP